MTFLREWREACQIEVSSSETLEYIHLVEGEAEHPFLLPWNSLSPLTFCRLPAETPKVLYASTRAFKRQYIIPSEVDTQLLFSSFLLINSVSDGSTEL